MSFVLDTDTCSAYLKNVRAVRNRFLQYGGLHLSVVTMAELEVWVRRKRIFARRWLTYLTMLKGITVLDLDQTVAQRAGEIGAELYDKGLPIDLTDLLIATTAVVHGLTLVTHNTQDFVNVPGLTIIDWLVP
jgi:tRNA(fMet)-specific endonuclease VapC